MSLTQDPAATFRQEAEELFQQLEQGLLDLESHPHSPDIVGTVFRALHTIKGSGAIFGYEALAAFTHHVENVYHRVRAGELAVSPALIDATLAAKDHMRGLMAGTTEGDGATLLDALSRAASAAPPTPERSQGPEATYRVHFALPEEAFRIGTDPAALIADLLALGHGTVKADLSALPPLAELNPAACHLAWEVMLTTARPPSEIEEVFLFVSEHTRLTIDKLAPGAPAAAPTRAPPAPVAESVVKVAAARIDGIMDEVGELVIAEARLRQLSRERDDPDLLAVAEEIERLTGALRESTMSMRMVPVGSLFGRFRRVVRDLAHELGKDVRLVTRGEETELDKAMVESLHDPLVHLIRNAIDHGIEAPDGRGAKPREGTITLSAEHRGAEVLIAIADDGNGLDRDRLRAKAEELGLVEPGADLSEADLFAYIFHPGFSTAATVSDVSGRGVGMDVVRNAVESMRGLVDVASRPGLGTTITLRLPLTLAIIDGLLVRVADQRYVLPLSAVEECVELPPSRGDESKFLELRGELLPFLRLRDIFGLDAPPPAGEKVVVVASGERRIGLVVDQLLGGHQTVVKSLGRLHRGVRCVSGATILGDGRIVLILDVLNLTALRQSQEEEARRLTIMESERHVD